MSQKLTIKIKLIVTSLLSNMMKESRF